MLSNFGRRRMESGSHGILLASQLVQPVSRVINLNASTLCRQLRLFVKLLIANGTPERGVLVANTVEVRSDLASSTRKPHLPITKCLLKLETAVFGYFRFFEHLHPAIQFPLRRSGRAMNCYGHSSLEHACR